MTRKAIIFAAVAMLAGYQSGRAQQLVPVPAPVIMPVTPAVATPAITPDCTTCASGCTERAPRSGGLINRMHERAVEHQAEKHENAECTSCAKGCTNGCTNVCANDCTAPVSTRSGLIPRLHEQAVERRAEKHEKAAETCCEKSKSKWTKFSEWLCYKPEHRGEKCCECKHCCGGDYNIPLWTYFPCQGGSYGSVVAGANTSCNTSDCSKGCKTCGAVSSCGPTDQPCVICRFHKD